jgi:hypothetical protein
MKRLVFVRHQRFEKGRQRCFTVAVWKVARRITPPTPALWGPELAAAWQAVEAAE